MSLPNECHMHPLERNFADLRNHSFLVNVFGGKPINESLAELTEKEQDTVRRFRILLVYQLLKCARHYQHARENILAQIRATESYRRDSSGGFVFDDCISSLDHIRVLGHQMMKVWPGGKLHYPSELKETIETVKSLKNYTSHMHGNVEKPGPVLFSVSEDGRRALLGSNNIDFSSLATLIHASFDAIATLYPQFSPEERVAPPPTALRLTATTEIVVRTVDNASKPNK